MHPLAWFTVKVWPPMVIVPDRAGPVVASTLYRTEPLPVSLAPEVISIHGTLLTAVHAHPPPAVTVTDAFLIPSSETFALVAEIEIERMSGDRQRARARAAGVRSRAVLDGPVAAPAPA